MRTALVTFARGRRTHLLRQAAAVAAMSPRPDRYLVVSLDREAAATPGAEVIHRPLAPGERIPSSAARNEAIAAAANDGAELVVCLDADCLPGPNLVARLLGAADGGFGDGLLCGPVGRLGPLPADRLEPRERDLELGRARARAGPRPVPGPGEVAPEPRYELFWSLSFAVRPAVHRELGGFDEAYEGYGAEDTDYGFRARRAGVPMHWVGGAWSYHQHHPVSEPPVEHLDDIVANARRFRDRWGRWPMEGWLARFARMGLVAWQPEGSELELLDARRSPFRASGERTSEPG